MAANEWVEGFYADSNGVMQDKAPKLSDSGVYTLNTGDGQTATVTGYFDNARANEMVERINEYRKENGVAPLAVNGSTTDLARLLACERACGNCGKNREQFEYNKRYILFPSEIYGGCTIFANYGTDATAEGFGEDHEYDTYFSYLSRDDNKLLYNSNYVSVACFVEKGGAKDGSDAYYWVMLYSIK